MVQQHSENLGALRAKLDAIDDEILALVERRLEHSLAVAAAKDAEGDSYLKLRPRRQAEIVERLKSRSKTAAPELIEALWREIMAHSLHAQSRLEFVLAPAPQPELAEARVRARFGSAAPIRWAASAAHALRAALVGEAVAIVAEPPARAAGELRIFDVLTDDGGALVAYAVGRVSRADIVAAPPSASARAAGLESAAKAWQQADCAWAEHSHG